MELAAALVTRSIVLPVSPEDAWRSIGTADGLTGWLGDAVDLDRDLIPGAAGTIEDEGVVRRVVVTEVDAGRSIGFVWWDEEAPGEASTVTIALAPGDEGTSTVIITERLAGSASASRCEASVADLVDLAEATWARRLEAMVGGHAFSAACV